MLVIKAHGWLYHLRPRYDELKTMISIILSCLAALVDFFLIVIIIVEAGRIVWLWMRAGGGTVCKDVVG